MADNSKPILCLDFDGVLHSYSSGWQGADVIPDPPVDGAREFLEDAIRYFEVHIHSSRSHQPGGITAMRRWCRHHFGIQILDNLSFPTHKPSAMVTLDDRAVTFRGRWPRPGNLRKFRPWNKR